MRMIEETVRVLNRVLHVENLKNFNPSRISRTVNVTKWRMRIEMGKA